MFSISPVCARAFARESVYGCDSHLQWLWFGCGFCVLYATLEVASFRKKERVFVPELQLEDDADSRGGTKMAGRSCTHFAGMYLLWPNVSR